MAHHHDAIWHGTRAPWPIWLMAGLVLCSLVVVAGARLSGVGLASDPIDAAWTRSLRFEDRPDGSIAVLDGAGGREVARFEGEQGFARGALRALARERQRRGLGSQPAFELIGHRNGRLTLLDPATGERIALESFGPSNVAVFARLREAGTASPAATVNPRGATP